jgi:hypothetical protein
MKIKFNHDEKDTAKAFGITDAEHTEAAIKNMLSIFLQEEGHVKTFSKLGELLQDRMSDNEILLLATQQVYEAFREHEEQIFNAFIEYIKKLN